MARIPEHLFWARAILACMAILIAAALGGCHYDQSPENHRWRVYRFEKVR